MRRGSGNVATMMPGEAAIPAAVRRKPYGRQEEWQDSPEGWPQSPTYSRWASSKDIAAVYGPDA